MSYPCYLAIRGSDSDRFEGPILSGRHKGKMETLSFSQQFERRALVGFGEVSSRGTLHYMTVFKAVDSASPRLLKAMFSCEKLPQVDLEFYEPGPVETAELFYRISLGDAYVHEVSHWAATRQDPDFDTTEPLEKVRFISRRVTWRDEQAGVESQFADPPRSERP